MSESDNRSDLLANLQQHAGKVNDVKDFCTDEAKTRSYLVEPLLEALGYDCRDPRDVVSEFTADVADKKGEKVDYALMRDGEPVVLVEAKTLGNTLGRNEREQLQRYFPFTRARLAVLTDGIRWHWYKGRSEHNQSHQMASSPFLSYDAREPSQSAAEWLTRITKDGFNRAELLRIARRDEFTGQISDWIDRTFLNPTEKAAAQLRKVVGLDATDQETNLVLDATRLAWDQVVADQVVQSGPGGRPIDESRVDEPASAAESSPTGADTVFTSASELRFVSRLDDQLVVGGGETLSSHKKRRAWRIHGRDWQVEKDGARVTLVVLGQMLGCDARRDDEHALADQFGLRVFKEPPHSNWEPVPGFGNLFFNKNKTAEEKRDILASVANDLVFDPPDKHPLSKDGKIEWWLPRLNA